MAAARRTVIRGADPVVRARSIIGWRARQALARRRDVVRRGDPDSVHDLRVATRRLQEAIGLFSPLVPAREGARLRRRVRRVRRELAPLRDADVLAELAAGLVREGGAGPRGRGAATVLVRDLADEAQALRMRLRSPHGGLDVRGLRRRTHELLRALRRGSVPMPGEREPSATHGGVRRRGGPSRARLVATARAGMNARARTVASALRRARSGRAALIHRLRIEIKKYRYAMELLDLSGVARPGPAIDEARRIQEALGALHDADVLIGLLLRRPGCALLADAVRRRRRSLARKTRVLLAAFRPWRG